MDRSELKLPRGVFEVSPGSNKFGIRVTDANGNRPEKVIGTRAEAVKAAKEARNNRRRSKVLAPEKPKPTFREIAELAIAYAQLNHTEPGHMESALDYFCRDFGDRIAETISATEIKTWLNEKAKQRGWSEDEWTSRTKRTYCGAIRRAYREAMRLGLLEVDPTEQIELPSEDQKEVRAITAEELDRIRASIAIPGNHLRTPAFCRKCLAQLEIAGQSGMRKSEQFRATWEKIDWKRHVLFVPKSKNTNPRDVYLNSYVIAILRALQAEQSRDGILPTGRIFDIGNPRAWFERTRAHAQVVGITWHCLRHQFATNLVSVNVPIKHVQDLMGQIDWRSTARYIHPDDKKVFEAIASIADGNIPEYLLNKAYIRALLDDDDNSAPAPMREAQALQEEIELISPVEAQPDHPDLPPGLLSSIPREELYDLVWSAPMMHVASRLGRSDVAVAKTCRKVKIPVPGRGYWNKLAAGKPVPPRPPLPPLPNHQ